jgi:MFS transporter, putative metabolite:H+ symporter
MMIAQTEVGGIVGRIEQMPTSWWHVRTRIIVGTATFFDAFDAMAIAYVLPVLAKDWALRPQSIGLIIALGYVGQLIGALFFGRLADRRGRLPVLVATVTIFSLCSCLLALSWNLPSLLFLRLLQGIGLGGEVPAAASYISEITRAKGRGKFVLLYELIFPIGVMVAASVSYWVVPRWGWRWLFVIGGASALLTLLMRRVLPESPRWLLNAGRVEEAEAVLATIEGRSGQRWVAHPQAAPDLSQAHSRITNRLGELFAPMYRRRTIVVWIIWFMTYLANYGMTTWLPSLYTTVYKLTLEQALRFILISGAFGLLGSFMCAMLIDRVGRRAWLIGALGGGALTLLVLWWLGAATATIVLVCASVANVFVPSVCLALYIYTPELYPTRMRALGISMASAWLRLAAIIGPLVVGAILARSNIHWVFLIFGVALLIGSAVTALFAEETREQVLEVLSP